MCRAQSYARIHHASRSQSGILDKIHSVPRWDKPVSTDPPPSSFVKSVVNARPIVKALLSGTLCSQVSGLLAVRYHAPTSLPGGKTTRQHKTIYDVAFGFVIVRLSDSQSKNFMSTMQILLQPLFGLVALANCLVSDW